MTALRPSGEICLHYAAGVIDPALAMLVAAHLRHAPETADEIERLRRGFGALLSGEAPAQLSAGACERALAGLETQDAASATPPDPPREEIDVGALRWRWAGPGRRIAPIDVPGSRYKTFALEVGAGRAMLEHSHRGQEWTLVLRGAYRDEDGVVRAGDFVESDSETLHRPVADAREGCLCVSVLSEPLAVGGVAGALTRWLLR